MDKLELTLSLRKAIVDWIYKETSHESFDDIYIGDQIAAIMASAAMLVLEGIYDSQLFMRESDLVKD